MFMFLLDEAQKVCRKHTARVPPWVAFQRQHRNWGFDIVGLLFLNETKWHLEGEQK